MKVVLALLIAVLSAIESFLLALLFISLLVAPGGSGEFTGLNQFADVLFAGMTLPPLTFVIVLILVLKYHSPGNHKALRSFAWGLGTAVAIVPIVVIFTRSPITPWTLGINAMVLAVWAAVIMWRRVTEDEHKDDSFPAGA